MGRSSTLRFDVPWYTTMQLLAQRMIFRLSAATRGCCRYEAFVADFCAAQNTTSHHEPPKASLTVSFYFPPTCYTLCENKHSTLSSRRRVKVTKIISIPPTLPHQWLKITSTLCSPWKQALRDFQGYFDLKLSEQCTLYFSVVFVCYTGTASFRIVCLFVWLVSFVRLFACCICVRAFLFSQVFRLRAFLVFFLPSILASFLRLRSCWFEPVACVCG